MYCLIINIKEIVCIYLLFLITLNCLFNYFFLMHTYKPIANYRAKSKYNTWYNQQFIYQAIFILFQCSLGLSPLLYTCFFLILPYIMGRLYLYECLILFFSLVIIYLHSFLVFTSIGILNMVHWGVQRIKNPLWNWLQSK